ncbi:eukaryotic translation initiation factor 4 gamma 3-like [Scomber scombrus]|uniref:Eukaryotic translation initiation factor 4 gamma 3-like n=1 Tax=Scomber scombrus TaxID=13677 RepID=A0AAV1NSR9_SCOSC
MASHITLQAQQTEKGIKKEFQKLYQFLRAEETARIDAVRKEATLKSEAMKIRIVNLTGEISSLSDKIKPMEGEIKAEDISFMLNVKSSTEWCQSKLPEPESPSEAQIDEAKHLGNLLFTVWGKMRNIIQYTPVTLDSNTGQGKPFNQSKNFTHSTSRMKAQKLPYNPVLGYKRFSSGKQCCNEEAENAWKPGMERQPSPEDTEVQKTQELFRRIRSILNKITPQTFRQLMKQITELAIDTEERLKGVIDLVFEKAIKEPSFSVVYANMCRCLMGLKVPLTDKRGTSVNFRKLLLNRCQKGFEEKYERNQNKLDSAALSTEHEQLPAELEEAMDEAQRRSIGNIKFIGELFNLKMLTEAILHDCVVKLLNNKDEESLECLCTLLTTIGKGLDHEKAKPRIDQYFNQMTKIIEERKTSSKIRSMLQDVIDLRLHNWVSTRAEQGPKTIKQIHEEAKIAEQGKQRKVHHQHLSKNSKRRPVKPRPMATNRPAFSEEEIERSCKSIVKEFLHINDYKEVVQCVNDLDLGSQLHIFVRVGVELTLEHSQITRNHMGQLLFQLVQHGILPKPQFHKGFADMLKQVDDMVIDIPHIWLYLAELLCPVLKEGGFSMRELFSELSKPLLPMGRAGIFISEVLHILCKQTSHRTVVGLWKESGLNWTDFLPEGEDVQAFISQQKLQFILSEDSNPDTAPSKRILSPEELSRQLERLLLKDMASNTQIFDWVEGNLDESQMSSASFQRALMTAVGEEAVKDTNCRVDMAIIQKRKPVLISYLKSDTERQLQALYALQALMVDLNNPPNLLRMFFDCLYDEDIILEDTFFKWERSKDPAEQRGKGIALKSVSAFFTWLREAEEESD